ILRMGRGEQERSSRHQQTATLGRMLHGAQVSRRTQPRARSVPCVRLFSQSPAGRWARLRAAEDRWDHSLGISLEKATMRIWIAVCLALFSSVACAADPYPVRPIRIIITVVPGGGADITARAVGQKLTEAWGQQVIVDNRPGGNGSVGMSIAANA